jgi:hypothetical protein
LSASRQKPSVVSATISQSDSTWVRTRGLKIKSGHQAWNLTDLNKQHVAFGSIRDPGARAPGPTMSAVSRSRPIFAVPPNFAMGQNRTFRLRRAPPLTYFFAGSILTVLLGPIVVA